ncbi:C40 family peptidase [Nonomuraea sp. NPDC049714]|uniref:C40 family peptidase n=1 Tax=Nonomuraea sp. NPDC049714 TaxID=3364357 RepID=UPI00379B9E34
MIAETGLAPILAAAAALMGGIALLAGLAGGAYVTATAFGAKCDDARPGQPESVPMGLCEHLPNVAVAGAEHGLIALQAALRMRGVPYSWGGGGPSGPSLGIEHGAHIHGFDCSGLAEYAWAKVGVRIGGHTSTQWNAGIRVPRSQIRPGDLIFFARDPTRAATIHHVGIAVDASRMVHAPSTGSTVRIDTWAGDPYREREFIGAVRPSGNAMNPGGAQEQAISSRLPFQSAFEQQI